MANYNEKTVNGVVSDYQRSNKVIIVNELATTPEITFMEQIITSLPDGRKIVSGQTKCSDMMSNPLEPFDLLNPETDEVIGTGKYMDAYVMLYSIYRHVADKRDNPVIEEEPVLD